MTDEIEEALERWFNAEYTYRNSRFGEGRNRRGQEEDRDAARRYLAEKLSR